MRGYLAMWVVLCHVLWSSGYTENTLTGMLKLVARGRYAVDLFIIISGFVIFWLLDRQKESWRQFIIRRFFRLFPLFLVLFVVSIPISRIMLWNATHASHYWMPGQVTEFSSLVDTWWANLGWHIPLHLTMLHGVVPERMLADSPGAFLIAAWSVSLEWQFYLVAPLAYALAVSNKSISRLALCVACIGLCLSARSGFPFVAFGAALPFHVEFFFLGCGSYFLYRQNSERPLFKTWFAGLACLAILMLLDRKTSLIPLALWTAFLGLLLDHPSSISARCVSPLFNTRLLQFLGRISYSIYLAHFVVITLVQRAMLTWAPALSQRTHFWILLGLASPAAVGLSAALYRLIEAPGIKLGAYCASRLASVEAEDPSSEPAAEVIVPQSLQTASDPAADLQRTGSPNKASLAPVEV